MQPGNRIYVAGHSGLAGSALTRGLEKRGFSNLITRTHAELDLQDAAAVERFFAEEKPEYVLLAAAKVGGILANKTFPADFLRDNLEIQLNVIEASHRHDVKRVLFLGSSCIYPRDCPQPIKEEYLLTGPLESTNRPYALAKIAGVEMCWSYNRQYGTRYIAVMPTNLYGPGDNYDLSSSHVLPALMRKAMLAKRNGDPSFTVWGTGAPRRELMHSDDLADACIFLMQSPEEALAPVFSEDHPPLINVGTGEDLTIRELAETVARVAGFGGTLEFDTSKPDGTPRKVLDVSRIHALGWRHKIELEDGIRATYTDFERNCGN
ncbi:MAG TPA: GDP-L-fucose synthase [Acidobacteriaceae bacterium]